MPARHDLGFMIYWQLRPINGVSPAIPRAIPVMVETADNLISRFNETTGTIRSWDFGEWQFPVIVDNMMNLELLFWATEQTARSQVLGRGRKAPRTPRWIITSETICRRTTWSTYDTITGEVIKKETFQGYSDESHWARGQAWGLYGLHRLLPVHAR